MLDLFEYITSDTPILTPNRRLAAVFIKKYNAWQMQAGKTSWVSLDILPMTSWVKRLWLDVTLQTFTPAPVLLSPEAEQIIWETILRQWPDNKNLLQITRTAELARAAWGILKQWQVDFNNPELLTTEDGNVFQHWAAEFTKICREHNYLDTNSIAESVTANIINGICVPPKHIILAGFTEIIPTHQALLRACEQSQTQITVHKPERPSNTVRRISLADEDTEIYSMARWAKNLYEQNAHAMIGCVVPNLENLRSRVIEIFSEVFAANHQYVLDPTLLPFNISAGKSLALYPLIHLALQLLKFPKKNIPIDIINNVVCSPFIGGADSEQFARAKLITKLQEDNVVSMSLAELINSDRLQSCPLLRARLQTIAKTTIQQNKQLVSHWVNHFMERLNDFGWPGERNLNSPEYQTGETWLKLLAGFTQFENLLGAVSYTDALHFLVYLTTAQIYQPESPETTVQILGALEAAEIPFDHLWVMGLDDSNWPQAPRPNPFIPQKLQRLLNMPHATAERELTFTQQLTMQLRQSASNVIFSHANLLEDLPLRPSPIIMDIPEIAVTELELAAFTPAALQVFAARAVEKIQDETAPPIAVDEKPKGGSSIFKNQSLCPFKAFAESRLRAQKLEQVTLGLRPNQRGNILHKAMELIWSELKDQPALLTTPEAELENLVQRSVDLAIEEKAASKSVSNKYYLKLEAARLQKIIGEWLLLEKARPYFKIKSLEEKRSTTFCNIPINVIADRIDELADGEQIIIDYKSGKNLSSANWFGERPEEPQLPLYCVLEPEHTAGIVFARVSPMKMSWEGVSAVPLDINGVKAIEEKGITWSQQITEWQQTLGQLAADFFNGKASVDPKEGEQTCQYCHLQSLCRVNEVSVI
ncbi:MAG: PD-(D/E)XK nuclease family protein [Pseudomonadota bacterium]